MDASVLRNDSDRHEDACSSTALSTRCFPLGERKNPNADRVRGAIVGYCSEFPQRQIRSRLARRVQCRGVLLLEHHPSNRQHKSSECSKGEIERQVRLVGTRGRLGGRDEADVRLADHGRHPGVIGLLQHGLVKAAIRVYLTRTRVALPARTRLRGRARYRLYKLMPELVELLP